MLILAKSREKKIIFQMVRFCLSLFTLFFCFSATSLEDQASIEKELEQCLQTNWGVDPHTTTFIRNKFKPLLENIAYHSVIKEFITLSKKQNIVFLIDKKLKALPFEDGVYKAPKEHLVVFESPYVRIFWGSTEPGKREDLHEHAWKSVMVIIRPTTYKIEYPDGKKETMDFPIGAYELPLGERYACTNLGKASDEYLRFEVKD